MHDRTAPPTRHPMPQNTVRVKLPHSEVCLHLGVAGKDHWVAKVSAAAAQIYQDDGSRFSAPVLLAEAGLDEQGAPRHLLEPTCTAFSVCYRDAANWKNATRVIVADPWDEETYRASIEPALLEGAFFAPAQVGLPHAHLRPIGENDHPAHTFAADFDLEPLSEIFTIISEQPTLHLTWGQLCAAFAAITEFDHDAWPGATVQASVSSEMERSGPDRSARLLATRDPAPSRAAMTPSAPQPATNPVAKPAGGR
jgi:hypothetical protein